MGEWFKGSLPSSLYEALVVDCHWEIDYLRHAQDWDFEAFACFLAVFYNWKISTASEDDMVWNNERDAIFSAKSYYELLDREAACRMNFPWKVSFPTRVFFCLDSNLGMNPYFR